MAVAGVQAISWLIASQLMTRFVTLKGRQRYCQDEGLDGIGAQDSHYPGKLKRGMVQA